jgi:tRNA(Ile2) C34 agmatinyltransferase TiaS
MDATRCPLCSKRMKAVIAENGRTEFKCLRCDHVDPLQTDAVKWQNDLSRPQVIGQGSQSHCPRQARRSRVEYRLRWPIGFGFEGRNVHDCA